MGVENEASAGVGGHSTQDLSDRLALERDNVSRQLLLESNIDLNDKGNRFIPRGVLFRVISQSRVQGIAKILIDQSLEGADNSLHHVARRISPKNPGQICHCNDPLCTGSRVIFTSLLLVSRQDFLIPFLEHPKQGICDKNLPLRDPTIIVDSEVIPEPPKKLTDQESMLFLYWQSRMRSPFIGPLIRDTALRREQHRPILELEVGDEVTLPWTHLKTLPWTHLQALTESAGEQQSLVQKASIDRGHHEIDENESVGSFALKSFRKRQPASATAESTTAASTTTNIHFEREFNANQSISPHDHIVPLLASLKHGEVFYLVFPWAEGGNLKDIWSRYSTVRDEVRDGQKFASWYSIEWLLSECLGLADGLATTHRSLNTGNESNTTSQLHADIKPQNILCFPSRGGEGGPFSLKLADFGLSIIAEPPKFHLKVNSIKHTKTYRAPEYEVSDDISLKFDVWCLGCVFLELITWALLGEKGVEAFLDARSSERNDAKVDPSKGALTEDTFFKKVAKHSSTKSRWKRETRTTFSRTKFTKRLFLGYQHSSSIEIDCQVKDNVISHINALKRHRRSDQTLRDFLEVIESKMLVVDSESRASAEEVQGLLGNFVSVANGVPI